MIHYYDKLSKYFQHFSFEPYFFTNAKTLRCRPHHVTGCISVEKQEALMLRHGERMEVQWGA